MKTIDLAAVEQIIAEVAVAEIMPRFRKLGQGDIKMKGVDDPVTVADKAAEEALVARFESLLPGSIFVGEESCAQDPGVVSRFDSEQDVWVIDPIDGTRHFIEGKPEFGVMVALVRRKQTVAAWIHDPNTGDTLAAERGGGVWLRGKKMRLAGHDPACPKLALVGTRVKNALSKSEAVHAAAAFPALDVAGASAFDYGRLFTGEIHFAGSQAPRAAFITHRITKSWDHVPGLLLQSEAGGYAAALSGHPFDMQDSRCGLLIAPDIDAWESFHNVVWPVLEALDVTDT